jgi:hypothetical protein
MTTSDLLEALFRRESSHTCAADDCHCRFRYRGQADNTDLFVFRCEIDCASVNVIRGTEVIVSRHQADIFRCVDDLD